jgi:hypothetical protein
MLPTNNIVIRGTIAATLALLVTTTAPAAPIPEIGPVDVCGDVVSQAWEAARTEPGRPGLSGTLGHDRAFPALFRVILTKYRGIDGATARQINEYLGHRVGDAEGAPASLMVWLPHADPRHLDGAVSVCIEGFHVVGDEGGTWTRYRTLSVKR